MNEENTTTSDDTEVQTEARKMGWVPEAEWVGDPPPHGFLDAESFVERGRTVLPIIQSQNRQLREDLDKALKAAEEAKATSQSFHEFSQRALERERQEKADLLKQLEQERADAITEGDGEKAVETEAKIHELRSEPDVSPSEQAEIEAWLTDNPWFNEDPHLRLWSDGKALELSRKGVTPGIPTLKIIAEEVKTAFPEKFNTQTSTKPTVEGGGRRQANSGSRTWDDLPGEAKQAYADFKEHMPGFTKKEYLDSYEWEE